MIDSEQPSGSSEPTASRILHVVRSSDVESTLVRLLLYRMRGSVSFTEQDLKRAEQLQVEVRWDGHRYTLTSRWP